jgi:LysR family transcriptional regulator, glycine cleavage system transcriptional activator
MMRANLPLHALRVFDAVARSGGVRVAADALFVTPAAVTQQVKQLEQAMGVSLLRRQGRNVVLTDAGQRLHAGTSRHLRAIDDAIAALQPRGRLVRVTTVPSFAVRWLVPRLPRFLDQHPGIEVKLDAEPRLADLQSGEWDLAIREGDGRYDKTESRLLYELNVQPFCAPAYAQRVVARAAVQGWQRARLLHDVTHPWWPQWLERAAIPNVDATQGLFFSHTAMAIAAAVEGAGVALVPPQFVESDVLGGRLVALSPKLHPTGVGLYLLWSSDKDIGRSAEFKIFRDWVLSEAVSAPVAAQRASKMRRR